MDIDMIIYYSELTNNFIDENGFIIFDIYSHINPNMIFLFKSYKEDMLIKSKDGLYFIELIYENREDE